MTDVASLGSELSYPFGKEHIELLIPHRDPFLYVHRVLSHNRQEESLKAEYEVLEDAYFLQGHFPGHKVMPGVLILEGMAQSACICHVLNLPQKKPSAKPAIPYLVSIRNAKFRHMAVPGDTLVYSVRVVRSRMRYHALSVEAHVGDKLVASAELSAYISDGDDSNGND